MVQRLMWHTLLGDQDGSHLDLVVSDDTESLHGEGSVGSGGEEPVPLTELYSVVAIGGASLANRGGVDLDEVDLEVGFCRKAEINSSFF